MKQYQFSKIDLHILRELQREGRITYSALGMAVGLSTTPCMERVKKMERAGIIRGYSAQVDPTYLGSGLVVFIEISLERKSHELFRQFGERAASLDQVLECFLVSGEFDYLIKARVANMEEYRNFLGETLLSLPGVRGSSSYVAMEEVKDTQVVSVKRTLSSLKEAE